jgi:DNA polymerase III epsilon subunit-like protein
VNLSNYVVFDYETSSRFQESTQVLQIGSLIVNRKLEVVPDSEFHTYVRPDDFDSVDSEALAVNKIKLEDLEKAPTAKQAFEDFQCYLKKYNVSAGRGRAGRPIPVGYNILGFDLPITKRYEERFKLKLFDNFHFVELMNLVFLTMFEDSAELPDLKFDTLRGYLGISKEGKHHALLDAKDEAAVFCRLQKWIRKCGERANFKGAFLADKQDCNAGQN